jgi:hypothetical protein
MKMKYSLSCFHPVILDYVKPGAIQSFFHRRSYLCCQWKDLGRNILIQLADVAVMLLWKN